jgi:hypothetical protein
MLLRRMKMKFSNVVVGMKVVVKDGQPNTDFGLYYRPEYFGGKVATVLALDSDCERGLTVHVSMDDGTKLKYGSRSPWFSHKDLKRVKGDVK